MANTAVTNVTVAALNTQYDLAYTAATVDTANGTEVFDITPTKAYGKIAVVIQVGDTNGAVAYSFAKGDSVGATGAITGSVAQAKTKIIVIEDAKIRKGGKYVLTLTPATGKKLKTDHTAQVGLIELY